MRSLSPKVHAIFYALLIEGVVVLFSTQIRAGMCESVDDFSAIMLPFTLLFHIPGLIAGVLAYFPLRYILPSPLDGAVLVVGTIAGNIFFLSWLIYIIRKMRSPSDSERTAQRLFQPFGLK